MTNMDEHKNKMALKKAARALKGSLVMADTTPKDWVRTSPRDAISGTDVGTVVNNMLSLFVSSLPECLQIAQIRSAPPRFGNRNR